MGQPLIDDHEPVWMVVGIAYERGGEPPTFGPFKTKEEAQEHAASWPGRHVYDAVVNRRSYCGPWYF